MLKVINEDILERIGEIRTLLNNILRIKCNWIEGILKLNCFLHYAIEEQMTEVKKVVRRRTQFLNELMNIRIYWELKEGAGDRKSWKRQFIT